MKTAFSVPVPRHIEVFVGIDEAGRGPLAGPVAVGAVMMQRGFDAAFFDGIRDSKKLTERSRERWFAKIKNEPNLQYAVSLVSASVIDRKGIVHAVSKGIERVLARLAASPEDTFIYLDGGIKAPAHFAHQETLIKGDSLVPLISAGAIMAKVTRDHYMCRLGKRFPEYGFEVHKGYGTKMHQNALILHGPCVMHRTTFLMN